MSDETAKHETPAEIPSYEPWEGLAKVKVVNQWGEWLAVEARTATLIPVSFGVHSVYVHPAADFIPRQEHEALKAVKDGAYAERNKLVSALSKLFPASIERHDGADWEDDWRNVIYIDLPTGQGSWHIHDSELPLFSHLPKDQGRKWDGHTTEQKYERVLAMEPATPTTYPTPESVTNAVATLVRKFEADGSWNSEHTHGDYTVTVRRKSDDVATPAPVGDAEPVKPVGYVGMYGNGQMTHTLFRTEKDAQASYSVYMPLYTRPFNPAEILKCAEGMAAFAHGSEGFKAYRADLCGLLGVACDTVAADHPAPVASTAVAPEGEVELPDGADAELHRFFLRVLDSLSTVTKRACGCVQSDLWEIYRTIDGDGGDLINALVARAPEGEARDAD